MWHGSKNGTEEAILGGMHLKVHQSGNAEVQAGAWYSPVSGSGSMDERKIAAIQTGHDLLLRHLREYREQALAMGYALNPVTVIG